MYSVLWCCWLGGWEIHWKQWICLSAGPWHSMWSKERLSCLVVVLSVLDDQQNRLPAGLPGMLVHSSLLLVLLCELVLLLSGFSGYDKQYYGMYAEKTFYNKDCRECAVMSYHHPLLLLFSRPSFMTMRLMIWAVSMWFYLCSWLRHL